MTATARPRPAFSSKSGTSWPALRNGGGDSVDTAPQSQTPLEQFHTLLKGFNTFDFTTAIHLVQAEQKTRKAVMPKFRPGDRVAFHARDNRVVHGAVEKVYVKYAKVIGERVEENGGVRIAHPGEFSWRVHKTMLKAEVEAPDLKPADMPDPDLGRPFP